MADIVFVLGAGASAHAGAPLMHNFFDTARELRRLGRLTSASEELLVVEAAMEELQRTAAKSSINLYNLESVWGALEMGEIVGSIGKIPQQQVATTIAALRKVIVTTLEYSVQFRPDGTRLRPSAGYAAFFEIMQAVRRQEKPRTVAILTFNYDCALDYALSCYGMPVDYCLGAEQRRESVALCKLHGSLNWTRAGDGSIDAVELRELNDRNLPDLGWRGRLIVLEPARLSRQRQHGGSADPIIVPPTDSKLGERRQLAAVWKHAARHLSEASAVIVIGFSLPPTDEFFRSFFGVGTISRNPLEMFAVIDPSESAAARLRDLLSLNSASRFSHSPKAFEKSVAELKSLLNVN